MDFSLHAILILGSVGFLLFILYLMKKGKLEVKYSIIWLAFSLCMILFACFPYTVLVLNDIAGVIDPVNFIFFIQIIFILLILLSVSAVIKDKLICVAALSNNVQITASAPQRYSLLGKRFTEDSMKYILLHLVTSVKNSVLFEQRNTEVQS